MKLPWQQTTWQDSIKSNVALSFSNTALVIIALAAVIHSYSVQQEIILTPPIVNEKMSIGMDSASESYLKSFGVYVATHMGNITSANAEFVADSLSQFFDSAVYADIRKEIFNVASSRVFKEAAGSTKFTAESVIYDPPSEKVFVIGSMMTLTSVGATDKRSLVYEMEMRIVDRRPVIYSLNTYEGNTPHTAAWVEANTPKEAK